MLRKLVNFIVTAVVLLLCVVGVISIASSAIGAIRYMARCEAAGGVWISAQSVCVRRDALIPMETNHADR